MQTVLQEIRLARGIFQLVTSFVDDLFLVLKTYSEVIAVKLILTF